MIAPAANMRKVITAIPHSETVGMVSESPQSSGIPFPFASSQSVPNPDHELPGITLQSSSLSSMQLSFARQHAPMGCGQDTPEQRLPSL